MATGTGLRRQAVPPRAPAHTSVSGSSMFAAETGAGSVVRVRSISPRCMRSSSFGVDEASSVTLTRGCDCWKDRSTGGM